MSVNDLWAEWMFISAVRLIPFILAISNASQELYRNNAFLTQRQAASLFLHCFSFTPLHAPSFGHLVGGSEERRFALSFSRSVLFSPLVSEHSCWWDGIPGLCLRSGRAQRCLMMGYMNSITSFFYERNLKWVITCCYNLRTQLLMEIGLHIPVHISTL